ncbi:MAG: nucleotidyltransferase domain-containing protein [Thioalkalivibrio sp.]|jgi:predicted nucleotidyltransferase|nr:nucleotidyltransferase domain-containing protein [Thioalkalivibrio sp.]
MDTATEIARIRRTLEQYPELELAILFGSLAHGRARFDSDLDLAVSAGSPLDTQTRIALIDTLAAATGRPVDLVDLTQAGEPLLGEIMTRGTRLLGSDEAHARYLTRHLIEQADFLPYRNRILAERRDAWTRA